MDGVRVVMEKVTTLVTVHGEVDMPSVHDIGNQLRAALDHGGGARCLVIDLRGVTFLDSAGLHMLLDVHRDLAQRGVDCFLVVEHGSAAARLVEVTGLDAVLPTHHRVGDALEAARRCVEHVVPGERTPTR